MRCARFPTATSTRSSPAAKSSIPTTRPSFLVARQRSSTSTTQRERHRGAHAPAQPRSSSTTLPLDQAIKIVRGNGSRKIAIFEDPNCGYCKRFERDLAGVNDITVYVFLYPILSPDSMEKSKAIWCSADRGQGLARPDAARQRRRRRRCQVRRRRSTRSSPSASRSASTARRRSSSRTATAFRARCRSRTLEKKLAAGEDRHERQGRATGAAVRAPGECAAAT